MKYHFIGIGGVSMSGLAKLMIELGHEISGCDINNCQIVKLSNCQKNNSAIKQYSNVAIYVGHSKDHITKDLDAVVVTSAALHITSPAREEIEHAKKMGIKVIKRSELIGKLMSPNNQISGQNQIGIAVAGMHGKTTTSSMIAHILTQAGYDPTILVGGEVRNIGASEKLGKGKYFVAEACEYDRQFLDFRPKIAVITNIEEEHLDTYPGGIKDIKQAFKKFIKLLPKDGLLVLNQDDKNSMSLMKAAKCKIKRVTINKLWPGLKLQVPGKHILFDATLAARVAHEIGIDSQTIQKALNNFKGAKRRFEIKGTKNGVIVVDDYGHHPTEIQATIAAANEYRVRVQSKSKNLLKAEGRPLTQTSKLIVVFQPHQYMRTKLLFKDFVKSFDGADKVIITDIYLIAGREPAEARADFSRDLVEAIKNRCHSEHFKFTQCKLREESQNRCDIKYIPLKHGTFKNKRDLCTSSEVENTYSSEVKEVVHKSCEDKQNYTDILSELKKTAHSGDLILTLGATDIYKVGEEFLK